MKTIIYNRKSSESEERQILSISAQDREVREHLARLGGVEIVDAVEEAKSAKAPGRPMFDAVLERIERGDTDTLAAWHPDRLARNSVDGGRIIYLLDTGKLKNLIFPTYTFENTPQGKFMLTIMFGQSKYYVDNLSENVKRGNRAKIKQGWWPTTPPIGYLNHTDPKTQAKTIISDPDRFALVQEIWRLMLSGIYSPRRLWQIAGDEMKLTTVKRKKIGGKPLSLSAMYRLLTNRFYTGKMPYSGGLYDGNHEAMITSDEFERVQKMLGRPRQARRIKHRFAYTGLMTCGECGYGVTAEKKTNRHGSTYTYYHCSKRSPTYRCRQRSVEVEELEEQLTGFLESIELPEKFQKLIEPIVERELGRKADTREKKRESLTKRLAAIPEEIGRLTNLQIRDLLPEEEYATKRGELEAEELRVKEMLVKLDKQAEWFEPSAKLLSLCSRAVNQFSEGGNDAKQLILKTVGSNPVLTDQKLSIEALKPFRQWSGNEGIPRLRRFVQEVRKVFSDGSERGEQLKENLRRLEDLEKSDLDKQVA